VKISTRLLLAICALLWVSQFTVRGKDPLPKDWRPDLDLVARSIEKDLEQSKAQQEMNLSSGLLAKVRDAELEIAYLRLYAALSEAGRAKLKAEQTIWLKKRERAVENTTPKDGTRGTIAPLEENETFLKVTEARTRELQARLKKLP
jgi:uncharacterized protein YecT (DUF1311 family)